MYQPPKSFNIKSLGSKERTTVLKSIGEQLNEENYCKVLEWQKNHCLADLRELRESIEEDNKTLCKYCGEDVGVDSILNHLGTQVDEYSSVDLYFHKRVEIISEIMKNYNRIYESSEERIMVLESIEEQLNGENYCKVLKWQKNHCLADLRVLQESIEEDNKTLCKYCGEDVGVDSILNHLGTQVDEYSSVDFYFHNATRLISEKIKDYNRIDEVLKSIEKQLSKESYCKVLEWQKNHCLADLRELQKLIENDNKTLCKYCGEDARVDFTLKCLSTQVDEYSSVDLYFRKRIETIHKIMEDYNRIDALNEEKEIVLTSIEEQLNEESYCKVLEWQTNHSLADLKKLREFIEIDDNILCKYCEEDARVDSILNYSSGDLYFHKRVEIIKEIKKIYYRKDETLPSTYLYYSKLIFDELEYPIDKIAKEYMKEKRKARQEEKQQIIKNAKTKNEKFDFCLAFLYHEVRTLEVSDYEAKLVKMNWLTAESTRDLKLSTNKEDKSKIFKNKFFKYVINNKQTKLSKEEFINNYETVEKKFLNNIKQGIDLTKHNFDKINGEFKSKIFVKKKKQPEDCFEDLYNEVKKLNSSKYLKVQEWLCKTNGSKYKTKEEEYDNFKKKLFKDLITKKTICEIGTPVRVKVEDFVDHYDIFQKIFIKAIKEGKNFDLFEYYMVKTDKTLFPNCKNYGKSF